MLKAYLQDAPTRPVEASLLMHLTVYGNSWNNLMVYKVFLIIKEEFSVAKRSMCFLGEKKVKMQELQLASRKNVTKFADPSRWRCRPTNSHDFALLGLCFFPPLQKKAEKVKNVFDERHRSHWAKGVLQQDPKMLERFWGLHVHARDDAFMNMGDSDFLLPPPSTGSVMLWRAVHGVLSKKRTGERLVRD